MISALVICNKSVRHSWASQIEPSASSVHNRCDVSLTLYHRANVNTQGWDGPRHRYTLHLTVKCFKKLLPTLGERNEAIPKMEMAKGEVTYCIYNISVRQNAISEKKSAR